MTRGSLAMIIMMMLMMAAGTAAAQSKEIPVTEKRPTPSPAPALADALLGINYSRDVGWAGTLAMELQRSGESTFFNTFNDDGQPAIGVWSAPISPRRFDEVAARLKASDYQTLVATTTGPPGTKLSSFGERREGQSVPLMRAFAVVPEPLAPVVRALEEVRRELRAHPRRVIRGQASWVQGTVARGGEATLHLSLTNVGISPVHISNPLSAGDGWSGLRLVFAAKGHRGGEQQTDLTATALRPVGAVPAAPPGAFLTLAAGQSIRFQARARIDLPAGSYTARAEYHSLNNPEDDAQFVGGVLWLDAGPLVVSRGQWWRLW